VAPSIENYFIGLRQILGKYRFHPRGESENRAYPKLSSRPKKRRAIAYGELRGDQ